MKKILILSLLFFTLPAWAAVESDFSNMCGTRFYNKMYAVFDFTPQCASGYYLPAGASACVVCPAGTYCPGGTFYPDANNDQGISYVCASGYYLAANTKSCSACPHGYTCPGGTYSYNQTTDQGIVIASYTCSSGYFLPANGDACTECPTGYTCPGGTYQFNANAYQGATQSADNFSSAMTNLCATNAAHRFIAVFVPSVVECNAGKYLPANARACVTCPAGSACVGGAYNFNATTTQGIVACDTGYSSVAGASSCTVNTINITWDHADAADVTANNAGSVTYNGDIRTPKKAQHINGKVFAGWVFNNP